MLLEAIFQRTFQNYHILSSGPAILWIDYTGIAGTEAENLGRLNHGPSKSKEQTFDDPGRHEIRGVGCRCDCEI